MSPPPLLPLAGALASAKGLTFWTATASAVTAFGSFLVVSLAPPDSVLAGLARAIEQPAVWASVATLAAHLATLHYNKLTKDREAVEAERVRYWQNEQQKRLHDARLNELENTARKNTAKIETVARASNVSLTLPPDDDYPELPEPPDPR